ncbi:MAG: 3-isopropylmalate dehydratase small subunit, partial [Bacillota bacterium]|nr:3-isopropylmalate dehydratase small subunit [Bacillota bacterium]
CMEDADPSFAGRVQPGDLVVAGENFGCGSSREHAPISLRAAGVGAVIAASFARIFYRNAINIGLPILESAEAAARIQDGDRLEVDLAAGEIRNLTRNETYRAQPLPEFIRELVAAGGLIAYVRERMRRRG